MKGKIIIYGIIFLICLPLLFINIKHSHDWGDDFAQYLHQTANICKGISQTQTGYIFNPSFMLGPPSYPAGFPLLLVPIYKIWGLSLAHFDVYISCYLLVLALLVFAFLQDYFSKVIAALAVLIFIYNPWTLNFKMEIMSEIPFKIGRASCRE